MRALNCKLVFVLSFLCVQPSLAADPKPDARTSTRAFEANVYLEYVTFVPRETLKPYLSAEGTRIFGGSRPKGDEEEQP